MVPVLFFSTSDKFKETSLKAFVSKSLFLEETTAFLEIIEFLIFCDDNFPSRILLKKDNEFELIDFLVKQSEKYQKILN